MLTTVTYQLDTARLPKTRKIARIDKDIDERSSVIGIRIRVERQLGAHVLFALSQVEMQEIYLFKFG